MWFILICDAWLNRPVVYQFEKINVSLSLSKAIYQYDQLRHPDSYRDSLTGFVVQNFQTDTLPTGRCWHERTAG